LRPSGIVAARRSNTGALGFAGLWDGLTAVSGTGGSEGRRGVETVAPAFTRESKGNPKGCGVNTPENGNGDPQGKGPVAANRQQEESWVKVKERDETEATTQQRAESQSGCTDTLQGHPPASTEEAREEAVGSAGRGDDGDPDADASKHQQREPWFGDLMSEANE
jgi:hypothetical protein